LIIQPLRNLLHPRDEIMRTMDRIYRYRMTTTSGGNLSIRTDNGDIWITPARVDKGNLTPKDIVCVRADGTIDGLHPPSSEFPFHKAIYAARPDIRAIVHAHPVALVAFSICRSTPNPRLFQQAHRVCGKVGFAPYACPGSEALGKNIAQTFSEGNDSVILENHGVVVGGNSMADAFERFESFEFLGKTLVAANRLVKAYGLSGVRYLDDEALEKATDRGPLFDAFDPPAPTPREQELRKELCEFVKRGCRQRLLISTEGSYSARVDKNSFLVTPTGKDREQLRAEDIVLVSNGGREAGKIPSKATRAHQAIYDQHPGVQSIVFAHPIVATAFSVTDSVLDVRTIPESYVFLYDVQRVPYGLQYGDARQLAEYVSESAPTALLENDGVVITGKTILDAFDRLEVLESTAEAVIDGMAIGDIATMPKAVIDELCAAFKLG
jgi:L-fuculose-phosphate aldolase